MAVKNIVLDMGNVLLTWDPEGLALRAAGNKEDAEALKRALFDTPEWGMIDAGTIDEEQLLRASLARAPEHLHDTLRTLADRWPWWMAPIPGADDFTRQVKEAGMGLYLLSNACRRFPGVLARQPFYARFDGVMVSAHEGIVKPDPLIYQRLCGRFSLLPEECLFVDDMPVNVKGAEKAGMAGYLFDGDYQKLRERMRGLGIALDGTSRA